jgi:AraC-like DNA-binding protein
MAIEQYQKIYLYKRVVQAKLFIDNHYAENIDLNNIADEAHFSKFHFIRLFKNIYGKTPHHYLTQVRIDVARQLLTKSISISEVCFSVGFNSETSFAGLFKKQTGLPPSTFQKQQQKRQTDIASSPLHFIPNCFVEQNGWAKKSNFQEVIK